MFSIFFQYFCLLFFFQPTDEHDDTDDIEEINESLEHVILDSSTLSFQGMRVKESIDPSKAKSYFKVQKDHDNKTVYIHKQTAAWVLMKDKHCLSSDRLTRVTQAQK